MRRTWQKPKLVVLVRGRPEGYVMPQSSCEDSLDTDGISLEEELSLEENDSL